MSVANQKRSVNSKNEDLLKQLQKVKSSIPRLSKHPEKDAHEINMRDALVKQLAKENQVKFDNYESKKAKMKPEKQLDVVSDIVFTNFNILDNNSEILKRYTSELYDRFDVLCKVIMTLTETNRYLLEELETLKKEKH